MTRSQVLDNFVNDVATNLFKMTIPEAHEKHVCIDCKSPIRLELGADASGEPGQIYSDAGKREYAISALCETCYDNIMGGF